MSDEDNEQKPDLPDKREEADKEKASPIQPEVLRNLPPEVRKAVEFTLQSFSAPFVHPVTQKITEGHIDKLLDQTEKDSQRDFDDTQSSRRYGFAGFLVICALFVFVTVYLASMDKELYRDVFKVLIGLVGGFGGGFAFKGYLDRNKE